MSWWEVIALWKRLALSAPIPRKKAAKRQRGARRGADTGRGDWAWSRRLDTNQTNPAAAFFNHHSFSLFWWENKEHVVKSHKKMDLG